MTYYRIDRFSGERIKLSRDAMLTQRALRSNYQRGRLERTEEIVRRTKQPASFQTVTGNWIIEP